MLSLVHPSSVIIKVAKVVCPHHLLKIVCSLHASAQHKNNPSFDRWRGCTATFWNALLAVQAFRRRPTYPASSSLKPSGRPSQFLSVRMSYYYVMWHMFFQEYPSITSIFHFVKQPKYPPTCWTCRFEGVPCIGSSPINILSSVAAVLFMSWSLLRKVEKHGACWEKNACCNAN